MCIDFTTRESPAVKETPEFIGSTLSGFAALDPHETAIHYKNERISRARLAHAAQARANFIKTRAAHRPKAVLDFRDPLELLIWFLAVSLAGGEAQVVDPDWPDPIKQKMISLLQPSLVLPRDLETDAFHMPDRQGARFREDDIAFGPSGPDESFYVGFTSGSTELPKGYRRSHSSWIKSFEAEGEEFAITSDDVISAIGSLSHSLFLYAALRAVQVGARLILSPRFDPHHAVQGMRSAHATIVYAAPSHLKLLERVKGPPVTSVRLLLSSGSKWLEPSDSLSALFPCAEMSEFYGTSELSFVSVRRAADQAPKDSVGRPFPHVHLTIRDREGLRLPSGEVGRIYVESPFLFQDYVSDEQSLHRCGTEFSVGDLGWLDERGFLFLEGRENRMIVTSGKNVYPEQLEHSLMAHAGIAQAAVLGVEDDKRGSRLVACIMPRAGCSVSARDLIVHLKSSTSASLIPLTYLLPHQWRWTRSGKTDFAALADDVKRLAYEIIP